MVVKVCRTCKKTLPLSDFHKSKVHSFGVKNNCAKCANAHHRKNYTKRYRTDKDKKRLSNWHLVKKYNISLEEYQQLYEAQNGCCAICKKEQQSLDTMRISRGAKEILVVDHDHLNKRVRGLLCQGCNQALGLFKDDPTILIKAIEYLATN